MKQVLRFNKVIKRIVFTGDLILLNGTFLSLYTLFGANFLQIHSFTHFPKYWYCSTYATWLATCLQVSYCTAV